MLLPYFILHKDTMWHLQLDFIPLKTLVLKGPHRSQLSLLEAPCRFMSELCQLNSWLSRSMYLCFSVSLNNKFYNSAAICKKKKKIKNWCFAYILKNEKDEVIQFYYIQCRGFSCVSICFATVVITEIPCERILLLKMIAIFRIKI
jgi:hypothetical protein